MAAKVNHSVLMLILFFRIHSRLQNIIYNITGVKSYGLISLTKYCLSRAVHARMRTHAHSHTHTHTHTHTHNTHTHTHTQTHASTFSLSLSLSLLSLSLSHTHTHTHTHGVTGSIEDHWSKACHSWHETPRKGILFCQVKATLVRVCRHLEVGLRIK